MAKGGMSGLTAGSLSACLLITASLILTGHCYSATYKYVDHDGTVCFTDNRQSIPEAYKKRAVKIIDEKENADKPSNTAESKEKEDSLMPGNKESSPKVKAKDAWMTITNSNFFGPVVAIVLFISLFVVIGKAGRSLGHQRMSSLLRIALTLGTLVYLFYTNVETLSNTFASLNKEVADITKRTEKRNKNIEDAAKDPL